MIGIAYQARLAAGSRPAPGPEMLEIGVFTLDSLPPLAFPSHRQVVSEYVGTLQPDGRSRAPSTPKANAKKS
jgi:hypothetical protein